MTIKAMRELALSYGVKVPNRIRKADLATIVRKLQRPEAILAAYYRQTGRITDRQARRYRKAERRRAGMVTA